MSQPSIDLSSVERRVREHADVHPCYDCGLPTNYSIGTYWLAPDSLWKRVVGSESFTLCPGCFEGRALAKGIAVMWRAEEQDVIG